MAAISAHWLSGRVLKRALGAAVFCLACNIEPATTTPATYADFLKLSSQLTCEASLRCCGSLCTLTTDAAFFRPRARAFTYLNAGLFGYDRPAAVECLAALQQRYTSCDAALPGLPPSIACDGVLIPQAPVGSVCETGVNPCGPGSTCVNTSCTIRRTATESCASATTTQCLSDEDSCCLACTGFCAATLPIGQVCTNTNPAAQCQAGAFCSSSVAKCTAYAESGQTCSAATMPCNPRSGLRCLAGSQTCGPPQPDGAVCTDGTQCASTHCLLPNYPGITQGTCQPHPAPLTVRAQLCQSLN
jgi:hypothetical protein